jgi:hypothetical protein
VTNLEAKQIMKSKRHIAAMSRYRRGPMAADDETFRLAAEWFEAANILSKG